MFAVVATAFVESGTGTMLVDSGIGMGLIDVATGTLLMLFCCNDCIFCLCRCCSLNFSVMSRNRFVDGVSRCGWFMGGD